MMTKTLTLATVSALALASSATIAGAVTATAAADINLRSGPGGQYQIDGVILTGDEVEVAGCNAEQSWCQVTSSSGEGWAYAPYLTFDQGGEMKPLSEASAQQITIIEDNSQDEATALGAGMGAVAGALLAGPVGAVAGSMMTGIAAHNSVSDETTVYIQENPVDPVFLTGEPVVGAAVPGEVTLYDVPENQEIAYLNVNGNDVVVERETRRIVYVIR
ncbi:hypothetical protein C4N9_14275 [Pararhodobacter marinus]|uniref:SH3b domain-containing protein n=1 Tax=Pararhodobacter marinus TaxID=2184063 RepID=A0A2U2C804_9RHOB|nr:DUF1236 domain-containing protein [Pararhodobacter marinus]PWE28010.1 hypothetical protein C4N9_14275 [Pararhodobacter marinus]